MNIKATKLQNNKKIKKYFLYMGCSAIFIVLSAVFFAILIGWTVTFSEQKDFYINGELVYGTVTGYTRTGGYRRSTHRFVYRVELITKYQSEDGTQYQLYEYADKYKYTKDENVWVIEQEIGKQMPMIIDGKGKCLTASMDVDDYNKSIGWCIAGTVICVLIFSGCVAWLGISINKIIKLKKLLKNLN